MKGIIYVLTNPAMINLVKIGKTDRGSVAPRLRELFTTGVPFAFDCAYAGIVENNAEVEKAIHARFAKRRLLAGREFFLVTAPTVIKAIKPYELEDITLSMRKEADSLLTEQQYAERRAARKRLEQVRPSAVASRDAHKLKP